MISCSQAYKCTLKKLFKNLFNKLFQLYSKKNISAALTWIIGVRLQTVDDVFVSFQQHDEPGGATVPHEDVAAVRATHHHVVTPESGFLDLRRERKKINVKVTSSLFVCPADIAW